MSANEPHPLIRLAKESIKENIEGRTLFLPVELDEKYGAAAGLFVTLKKDGQLRGCIGSLNPREKTLAREVARNARLAASKDPRFPEVALDELDRLTIQIEVITPPEPVENPHSLDPAVDGLIVRSGKKQGVLLPGLEGVDTVDQQIAICRKKGEIRPEEKEEYFTFRVQHLD